MQAFDEFGRVPGGVVAGDVEEGPRDRQRGAQFMGGVRGEPLLFGDVGLELFEHRVERVGEFAELVLRPSMRIRWDSDPFPATRVASVIRVSGASIRPARIHPPRRPNTSRKASAVAAPGAKAREEVGAVRTNSRGDTATVLDGGVDHLGYVAQQEHPHRGEEQAACEQEEPGIAEGSFRRTLNPGVYSRASLRSTGAVSMR